MVLPKGTRIKHFQDTKGLIRILKRFRRCVRGKNHFRLRSCCRTSERFAIQPSFLRVYPQFREYIVYKETFLIIMHWIEEWILLTQCLFDYDANRKTYFQQIGLAQHCIYSILSLINHLINVILSYTFSYQLMGFSLLVIICNKFHFAAMLVSVCEWAVDRKLRLLAFLDSNLQLFIGEGQFNFLPLYFGARTSRCRTIRRNGIIQSYHCDELSCNELSGHRVSNRTITYIPD
jgi:hypothetical protein